MFTYLS